jgi:hypothetical protein
MLEKGKKDDKTRYIKNFRVRKALEKFLPARNEI